MKWLYTSILFLILGIYNTILFLPVTVSLAVTDDNKLDLSSGRLVKPYRWKSKNGVQVVATSATPEYPVSAVIGNSKKFWVSHSNGPQYIHINFPETRKVSYIELEAPEELPSSLKDSPVKYVVKTCKADKGKFKILNSQKPLGKKETIRIDDDVKRLFIVLYPTSKAYLGKINIWVPKPKPDTTATLAYEADEFDEEFDEQFDEDDDEFYKKEEKPTTTVIETKKPPSSQISPVENQPKATTVAAEQPKKSFCSSTACKVVFWGSIGLGGTVGFLFIIIIIVSIVKRMTTLPVQHKVKLLDPYEQFSDYE